MRPIIDDDDDDDDTHSFLSPPVITDFLNGAELPNILYGSKI
jgi:hypothetical protein